MSTKLGFWRTAGTASGDHWRETLVLTGYTVLGGLAPLWFGPLLLSWFSQPVTLATVAVHGEFALYSAAVIAPALYTLGRDRGAVTLPAKGVLLLISITFLVFAVAAYAPIATVLLGSTPPQGFDASYYSWSTAILFVLCLLIFIAVALVDNAMAQPAVSQIADAVYDDLAKDFDKLGDGSAVE